MVNVVVDDLKVSSAVSVQPKRKMNLLRISSVMCFLAVVGCNEPPLYQTRARAFLEEQKIDEDVIERLVEIGPLTEEEAQKLYHSSHIAVLHLLGSNPSITESLIETLAQHPSVDVRTGVASNPSTPVQLLLSFRTPGRYTTVNDYVARNPGIPEEILWEMHANGEASYASLALNPSCPLELMERIAEEGNETDRAWLATNPNLPKEIMLQLEKDDSEVVRNYLRTNPTYNRRHE